MNNALDWFLSVHNHEVIPTSCHILSSIPKKLTPATLITLLHLLDSLNICAGQPDNNFVAMITAKKGVLKARDGSTVATLDKYAPISQNGQVVTQTITNVKCDLLTSKGKCYPCQVYRATLRTTYRCWVKRCSSAIMIQQVTQTSGT